MNLEQINKDFLLEKIQEKLFGHNTDVYSLKSNLAKEYFMLCFQTSDVLVNILKKLRITDIRNVSEDIIISEIIEKAIYES